VKLQARTSFWYRGGFLLPVRNWCSELDACRLLVLFYDGGPGPLYTPTSLPFRAPLRGFLVLIRAHSSKSMFSHTVSVCAAVTCGSPPTERGCIRWRLYGFPYQYTELSWLKWLRMKERISKRKGGRVNMFTAEIDDLARVVSRSRCSSCTIMTELSSLQLFNNCQLGVSLQSNLILCYRAFRTIDAMWFLRPTQFTVARISPLENIALRGQLRICLQSQLIRLINLT